MTATTKTKEMKEQHSSGPKGAQTKKSNFFAAASMLATLLLAPLAYALPPGLGSIEGKAGEIETLVVALAAIIVAIGAVWCGIKFIKGDQDSWGYVWKFALGAILVYAAPDIVTWISG